MLIYWPWPVFQPSTMTVTHKLFKILSRHTFCIKCYCDLDLWPKMYRVIYWVWPIFVPCRMTVTHKLFKILSGHGFCIKWYCDLDLWPSDLRMYRGNLLTMINLPIKYHDCHSNFSRYWADMVFAFNSIVTLTFDLVTSEFIGVINWPWPIFLSSSMCVTNKLFKILRRHGFCIKWYCDLDLWPIDLRIYRGHQLTINHLPTKYHDCHSYTF